MVDELLNALKKNGDPLVRCEIKAYKEATFHLALRIKRSPDYDSKKVMAGVEAALRSAFSFDARDFGHILASVRSGTRLRCLLRIGCSRLWIR